MDTFGKRTWGRSLAALILVALCVTACGGGPEPTGAPTAPLPPTSEGKGRTITLADDTSTIALRVGERLIVSLGQEYEWTITITDEKVLGPVQNVTPSPSMQGVYEGLSRGTAMLIAAGDPPCRKAQPPCEKPSHGFVVDLIVQ